MSVSESNAIQQYEITADEILSRKIPTSRISSLREFIKHKGGNSMAVSP